MTEPLLIEMIHEHRERWQITRSVSPSGWIAVEYPTPTALRVLAARDLEELDRKIHAAQGGVLR